MEQMNRTEYEQRLDDQREMVAMEFRHMNRKCQNKGKRLVYPNQSTAANECLIAFIEGKLVVVLVAQPGTGKTGTALEAMRLFAEHPSDEICVPTENMWILSGMSDNDWKAQFSKNMLPSFNKNIYHRGKLLKQSGDLAKIRNGLIITDECHIASEKEMTVSKALRNASLNNTTVLQSRQIKMLDISATPESVSHDIDTWGDKATIVRLPPGPSYKGFQVMIDENRLFNAPELTTKEEIQQIISVFTDRYVSSSKKYFPFRLSPDKNSQTVIGLLQMVCNENGWELRHHDSSERIEDIDTIMELAPIRHTIILVKGFWRAAKRLVRTHVGGSYEAIPKSQNMTSSSQGLAARFCDNYEYSGDELNPDLRPIHYTDIDAIQHYLSWFNNGCDYNLSDYKSTRITSKDGVVRAQKSKMHHSNIVDVDAPEVNEPAVVTNKRIPIIVKSTSEEIESFKGRQTKWKTDKFRQIATRELNSPELLAIINELEYIQFSRPSKDSKRSYQMHVTDVLKAARDGRVYGLIDLKDDQKNTSGWQVFIDEVNHQFCILWEIAAVAAAAAVVAAVI